MFAALIRRDNCKEKYTIVITILEMRTSVLSFEEETR